MNWWTLGDPVRPTGDRLLLGVAVWSGYDLRLLDAVDASLADPRFADLTVDVFDCDQVHSPDGFEPYVPGIGFVHHTPVVGYWQNGELVEKACGYHGRQIVARIFGLDEQLLHRPITAAI